MSVHKVRYGIVGLGNIFALRHRPELAKIPEAAIEMVCDVNAELAGQFAQELGCRRTWDYRELVSDGDVDAVMVLTPPPSTRKSPWRRRGPASTCSARSRLPLI